MIVCTLERHVADAGITVAFARGGRSFGGGCLWRRAGGVAGYREGSPLFRAHQPRPADDAEIAPRACSIAARKSALLCPVIIAHRRDRPKFVGYRHQMAPICCGMARSCWEYGSTRGHVRPACCRCTRDLAWVTRLYQATAGSWVARNACLRGTRRYMCARNDKGKRNEGRGEKLGGDMSRWLCPSVVEIEMVGRDSVVPMVCTSGRTKP
jgi:hypothetical protein